METEDFDTDLIESDVEEIEANEDNSEIQADLEAVDNTGGATENENPENASPKQVKPKRVVRNPQPKLNAETLKGNRGLTALESYFSRVNFKGYGHEEHDLSVIMKTYEYWCHRLFPKYPFDECIAKIEQLGHKKPVITHIKKIRLDMIVDDHPIPNINNDNDSVTDDVALDNQFDDLVDSISLTTPTEPSTEISEEQLERIRLNKERAEQKRREKLREKMESSVLSQEIQSQELDLSSQVDTEINNSTQMTDTTNAPMQMIDDEVMERIRINKEKAEQRRREKLEMSMQSNISKENDSWTSDNTTEFITAAASNTESESNDAEYPTSSLLGTVDEFETTSSQSSACNTENIEVEQN